MKRFERLLDTIDLINRWAGRIVQYLVIFMMFFMTFEVLMRYLFNSPTTWVIETNEYLAVTIVALGGGCILLNKGHVNIDAFYGLFGERTKAILDLLTSPLFFLFVIVLIWQTADVAIESWQCREHSEVAGIPVYPVHMILVAGACLILLQGFADLGRNLKKVIMKRGSDRPEQEGGEERGKE